MSFKLSNSKIIIVLLLLVASSTGFAHEGWILTPAEMLEWNSKPKPTLFTQWNAINVAVLGCAFLYAIAWVRLGFTGAREMFPDLQARLASYGDYSAVVLRVCLAWALLAAAFAFEPRVGNEYFQSATFLAPDLELSQLAAQWIWLREAQIVLGIMFLFGLYVRLASVLLLSLSVLALMLFGRDMVTYFTAVAGICIYLLLQGPGSRYIPLPIVPSLNAIVTRLASVPRERAQYILRILAGLNFLYLGVNFKVLQPNLALGIIETYHVPVLSMAPEFFVLMMAVVETLTGIFLLMGILMRPMSIFLLAAFIFFASFLEESFTAHMLYYGIMLSFLFNAAGNWRRPEATDKAVRIVIVGGGFSAVRSAMKLEKLRGQYSNVEVTLIAAHSDFVFGPMLPEVVGGSVQPANVVNPLRRILPSTRVIEAGIESVDTERREVSVKRSSGAIMSLNYDELILAQVRDPDFSGVGGLAQHGLPVCSIGDALFLRQSVMNRLIEAEHLNDPVLRRAMLGFAVIGGGPRGCGTVMEIRRLLQSAASAFPKLNRDEISVTLFESPYEASRLPHSLVHARNRLLSRCKIDLQNADRIESVSATSIYQQDESTLPCATIVNVRLKTPENLLAGAHRSWIMCDKYLRADDHQNIWLVGDNNILLKDCQKGHSERIRLGECAAYNAWAQSQGFPVRECRPARIAFLTLPMGRYSVVKVGPLVFGGLAAWLVSRASCLNALPSLERNLRMVIDWVLDIPFRNDIAVLIPNRTERLSQANFDADHEPMRQDGSGITARTPNFQKQKS